MTDEAPKQAKPLTRLVPQTIRRFLRPRRVKIGGALFVIAALVGTLADSLDIVHSFGGQRGSPPSAGAPLRRIETSPTARLPKAMLNIDESFIGPRPKDPHWIINGSAKLTNESDGWLQLTDNTKGKVGMALLNDAFSSRSAIHMEFDYATWGGTPAKDQGRTGNGFLVFLVDGTKTPAGAGAYGAALGYMCGFTYPGPTCEGGLPGLTGGYIGIGFDEFGHFSGRRSDDSAAPGFSPDQVVIRGSGEGTKGYYYLFGGAVPAGIATGSRAGARRVRITIADQRITIQIKDGQDFQTVIDQFDLAETPNQPSLPATFKIGFTGSTGDATNFHEIRNLRIRVSSS